MIHNRITEGVLTSSTIIVDWGYKSLVGLAHLLNLGIDIALAVLVLLAGMIKQSAGKLRRAPLRLTRVAGAGFRIHLKAKDADKGKDPP